MIRNAKAGETAVLPNGEQATIQQVYRDRPQDVGKSRVMIITESGPFMASQLRRPVVVKEA